MSTSLIASGTGAILAAIGSGMLLARCFRAVRADLIAWSIALLGLLISLGSQALGYVNGFDSAMFRGMELGGQVIAPLALILALSEVAAKGTAARFLARLYIPSVALIAGVVLTLDVLADKPFTKAWPDPAVYYQTVPDYVLMFLVGPLTALIAIIAVGVVISRSGQPGWNTLLTPQLMGGAAALALAYPALAALVAYKVHVHLPIRSLFAPLCAMAAVLAWLAGTRLGELNLARLHGRAGRQFDRPDEARDYEPFDRDGIARSGRNATRSFQRGDDDSRRAWHGDQDGGYDDDWRKPGGRLDRDDDWRRPGEVAGRNDDWRRPASLDGDYLRDENLYRSDYERPDATGDFAVSDYAAGKYAGNDYRIGDFATGDHDLGHAAGGWQPQAGRGDQRGAYDEREGRSAGGSHRSEEARAQLFGQIAIYTLLEDRVAEFDRLAEQVVNQVRSREPDTLVFIVHAVPSAPMQRILYEVYRDQAAYQWHSQQPHVTQFEVDRRPCVLATNVIELGLQQAKVSPFPSVTELFGEPGHDTSGFQRPDYLRDYGGPPARPGGPREHR